MTNRGDNIDLLLARIICHRDILAEDLRSMEQDRYVIRTVSCPAPVSERNDLIVIKQYEMTLSELIGWLEGNRSRDSPEQIIEISRNR